MRGRYRLWVCTQSLCDRANIADFSRLNSKRTGVMLPLNPNIMAGLIKLHENLNNFGFSEAEINDANNRIVIRNYFVSEVEYGGVKGEWRAHKVGVIIAQESQISERRVFLSQEEIAEIASSEADKVIKTEKTYEFTRGGKKHSCFIKNKMLLWQPSFFEKVGEEFLFRDSLSKTYLLSNSTIDGAGVVVPLDSNIRLWANAHIVNGILDKEWVDALCTLLNDKGLIFKTTTITRKTKEGKTFKVDYLVPHFVR